MANEKDKTFLRLIQQSMKHQLTMISSRETSNDRKQVQSDPATSKVHIRKPNSIILDVYGVLTSHLFKAQLKQYVRDHLIEYLNENWSKRRIKSLYRKLCSDSEKFSPTNPEMPLLKFDEELFKDDKEIKIKTINDINAHVLYRMDHRLYGDNLLILWGEVWQFGYLNGSLKAHVYDEVPQVLELWRMRLFIKLYTLASGQSQGQKMFFQHTTGGDLSLFIANYMDPSSIGKTSEKCFKAIVYALRDKPDNLVYMTDSVASRF